MNNQKNTVAKIMFATFIISSVISAQNVSAYNSGTEKILSLINTGVGKSETIPGGLVYAPGIESVLERTSTTSNNIAPSRVGSLMQIITNKSFNDTIKRISDEIQAYEEYYFASTSNYWQGLWTHTIAPEFNMPTEADRLQETPFYQGVSWNETFIDLPIQMPVSASVNIYDGPCGKGYVINYKTKNNGFTFLKIEGFACQSGQNYGWQ